MKRPNANDHWRIHYLIEQCWKAMLDRRFDDAYDFWNKADLIFRAISLPENPTDEELTQFGNMDLLVCQTKDTLGIYGGMKEREKKETLSLMAGLAMAFLVGDKADDVRNFVPVEYNE